MAVQGPANSVWLYWETPDAQWYGPLRARGAGIGLRDHERRRSTTSSHRGREHVATIAVGEDGIGDNPASISFSFDCNPYTAILYPPHELVGVRRRLPLRGTRRQ